LPPGLTFTSGTNSATITGTPTMTGSFMFGVQITDASGNTMQKTYTLGIIGIINTPTQANQGSAYSFQFIASGGTPPYTFSLEGALPLGLSMDSTGLISGTPTETGTFNVTVTVTDSS